MKQIFTFLTVLLLVNSAGFAQNKFGAKVFFDYTYSKGENPSNEFEIHRAYFTFQSEINKNLSYKFTTDVGRIGDDDRMTAFLKNALVKWKTNYGDFVFGLQGMNMHKVQEQNWGYRFIDKSAIDKYKFASTADLGIGYYNKLGKKFNYSVLLTNGSGYKKSENDNYKKVSVQAYYGEAKISKDGNFNFGGVFSFEQFDYNVTDSTTSTEAKTVLGGFVAYNISKLRVGVEYGLFNTGGSDLKQTIISGYANFSASNLIDIFARYDVYDPNTKTNDDGGSYLIAGLNIKPAKQLFIAPNIRYVKPQTGDAETEYKLNFQFKI